MVNQEERLEPMEYTVSITIILLVNGGEAQFPERENPNHLYLAFRQIRYIDWQIKRKKEIYQQGTNTSNNEITLRVPKGWLLVLGKLIDLVDLYNLVSTDKSTSVLLIRGRGYDLCLYIALVIYRDIIQINYIYYGYKEYLTKKVKNNQFPT